MTGRRSKRATLAAWLVPLAFAGGCERSPTALPDELDEPVDAAPAEVDTSHLSLEEREAGWRSGQLPRGNHSALLDYRFERGGTHWLSLKNFGDRDDRFLLQLDPVTAGTVEPAEIDLVSGQTRTVKVHGEGPARLLVISTGAGGSDEPSATLAVIDLPPTS
jgi:hypothetical protein